MSTKVTVGTSTKLSGETGLFFTAYKTNKNKKDVLLKGLPKAIADKVKSLYGDDFKSEASETFVMRAANLEGFRNIVLCGLGNASAVTGETVRRAAGTLSRDLNLKTKSVSTNFENLTAFNRDKALGVMSFTEGSVLGSYKFDELKSKNKSEDKNPEGTNITIVCKNKTEQSVADKAVMRAQTIAEAINFARYLGDMPGNLMTPAILASETVKAAKGTSLKVTVWDQARCEKEKMGNFVGVAKGSNEPCKFIIMEYKGTGAKGKPVCFVGKGLTFDSGGVSIKPSAGMEEMKYDMCGGAGVIATMVALAKLKSKVHAIAFVPATENMQNGWANKPGDVTTARNGKTTEVNNTDAEGRLILSDALVIASEHNPAFIVDAATLTGAMQIALGDMHTGYFTTSNKMKKAVEAAAQATDESVWQMPLVKEHMDDMKGTYADLSNIAYTKGAGSAKGAAYLAEFVGEGIPWAHFDIAATAWNIGSRYSYVPKKGASGVMIRTFINLAENWKA